MPRTALDELSATPLALGTFGAPLSASTGARGNTLAQLRGELAIALGNRTDLSDTQLNTWINAAYVEMMTTVDIEESRESRAFIATPEISHYLLPQGVWSVLQLQPNENILDREMSLSWKKIISLDKWRRLVELGSVVSTRRMPGYYLHWKRILALYPIPQSDTPFTLDFIMEPSALTLDDDVPLLPHAMHPLVSTLAASIGSSRLREYDKAAQLRNEYIAVLRSLRSQLDDKEDFAYGGVYFPRKASDVDSRIPNVWDDRYEQP